MKLAKFLAALFVSIILFAVFFFVFNGKENNINTIQTEMIKPKHSKSADDPTYAQELRALTAKVKNTENKIQQQTEEEKQRTLDLQNNLNALSGQVRQLTNNGQIDELKALMKQVAERNNKVETDNNTLREELKSISETLATLQQQQSEKDEKIAELSQQLETVQTTADQPTNNTQEVEDAVKDMFVQRPRDMNYTQDQVSQTITGVEPPKKTSNDHKPYMPNLGGNDDSITGLAGADLSKLLGGINKNIDEQVLPMKRLEYETETSDGKQKLLTRFPIYTLPPTTMLTDSTLLTPLIGRVPVGGNVNDPFRFQLEIGAENLAVNGHHIPGVQKAIASGYATGIREQSCVRATISTMTFIFEDGRISTVKGNSKDSNDGLGYLTDPQGTPCILGEYVNNASSYLKDRSMAAFLAGLAQAYGQSQVSYTEKNGGLKGYLSGNVYQFAAAQGIASTADEIAQYVRERAREAFDVVYVPQASRVQVILQEEIDIDYDLKNRKINYLNTNQGVSYD
ncbi:MAG: TIGR03752 family integrating conjugative element protein [Gammaproteobacteria bacterium]|nr:TIGR03752 family integrating conjugative element protein [Gammaproteobacteria bacterium]